MTLNQIDVIEINEGKKKKTKRKKKKPIFELGGTHNMGEIRVFLFFFAAFASVVLAWKKELNPDMSRVNPNGGAIAHGHPLGATGAILMTKLVNELERRQVQFGLQVICIGYGMSCGIIIQNCASNTRSKL
jgi:hypothetical protein